MNVRTKRRRDQEDDGDADVREAARAAELVGACLHKASEMVEAFELYHPRDEQVFMQLAVAKLLLQGVAIQRGTCDIQGLGAAVEAARS